MKEIFDWEQNLEWQLIIQKRENLSWKRHKQANTSIFSQSSSLIKARDYHCTVDPARYPGRMGPDLAYRQVVPSYRVGSSWANPGPSDPSGSRSGSLAPGAQSPVHATRAVTSALPTTRVPEFPVPPPMDPTSTTTAPLTPRRGHLSSIYFFS